MTKTNIELLEELLKATFGPESDEPLEFGSGMEYLTNKEALRTNLTGQILSISRARVKLILADLEAISDVKNKILTAVEAENGDQALYIDGELVVEVGDLTVYGSDLAKVARGGLVVIKSVSVEGVVDDWPDSLDELFKKHPGAENHDA